MFMKKIILIFIASALLIAFCSSASACTLLYVGSDNTDDGRTIIARSEDNATSLNKLMYVSPAGNHRAGEKYTGCYGFTHTFTHDAYRYTAFRDDNLEAVSNVCPDCGNTHPHTPFEAAGTNEKGVTVSATETMYDSINICKTDPLEDKGIDEADITTILLGEAATARDGVKLLTDIYDKSGCHGSAGVIIADRSEVWYIENFTGHQYIALKLNNGLIFTVPNISVIGRININDKEQVIASSGLIDTAVRNGSFVGDADAGIIDYAASYSSKQKEGNRIERLKTALYCNRLDYDITASDPDRSTYCITNLDEKNRIVPLHNGIQLEQPFGIADAVDFFRLPFIGNSRNMEVHIFQIGHSDSVLNTVEWISFDNARFGVFVPYYPLLTTDVDPSCKLGTKTAEFSKTVPPSGTLFYPSSRLSGTDSGNAPKREFGYTVLPSDWADSAYWCADALSNLITRSGVSDTVRNTILQILDREQNAIYRRFYDLNQQLGDGTGGNAAELATKASMAMQSEVHALLARLVKELAGSTDVKTAASDSAELPASA